MQQITDTALCLKLEHWPVEDRLAWTANCAQADPFDDAHYAADLSTASLSKTAKGYGRFLGFLRSGNLLDPSVPALDRVTRSRLAAYFRFLRDSGNADYTIIGRFDELHRAIKILSPGKDVSWIRRPRGQTIYSLLPKGRRELVVPTSAVLMEWGIEMMDSSELKPTKMQRLCAFRDGLLIAMLASRGRRLRSMQLLTLDNEIILRGGVYRIELNASQVKTKKPDRTDLPRLLTSYIDRYIEDVRPRLLSGRDCGQFWISSRGGVWTAKAIQGQILYHSQKRFGVAFGPHRFRHAIATTSAIELPTNPGLAAALLGISRGVAEESYNRCGQIDAALKFSQLMESRQAAAQARRKASTGHICKRRSG